MLGGNQGSLLYGDVSVMPGSIPAAGANSKSILSLEKRFCDVFIKSLYKKLVRHDSTLSCL